MRDLGFEGPVAAEPFNADVNALDPPERARVARESLTATLGGVAADA